MHVLTKRNFEKLYILGSTKVVSNMGVHFARTWRAIVRVGSQPRYHSPRDHQPGLR